MGRKRGDCERQTTEKGEEGGGVYSDTFHCLMFFSFSKNQKNWKDPAGKRTGKKAAGAGLGGVPTSSVVGLGCGWVRAWSGSGVARSHFAHVPLRLVTFVLAFAAARHIIEPSRHSFGGGASCPSLRLASFLHVALPSCVDLPPCPSLQLCKRLSRRSTGVA